jgi:deoxycytidine triphosphate deaminase
LTGVYSDIELEEAIANGDIIYHPLVPENIKGSSIDLTLGENFWGCDRAGDSFYYNPRDSNDVSRYFDGPKKAILHEDWVEEEPSKRQPFVNIPLKARIIVLRARERILGHTHEFVGIKNGTCQLQARSTTGRNGSSICIDAGWGDPGYLDRWTLELYNWNDEPMPLVVGDRVCQMAFYRTGPVRSNYGRTGKYHSAATLEETVANWNPHMMLPRAYNDPHVPPLPIDEFRDPATVLAESLKHRGLDNRHVLPI